MFSFGIVVMFPSVDTAMERTLFSFLNIFSLVNKQLTGLNLTEIAISRSFAFVLAYLWRVLGRSLYGGKCI